MAEYFVPSTGAQLFCRTRGEGKPLLLIHGAVCDSDFFEGAALVLAAKFRVVTYDWRGYSRSSGQLDEPFLSASAKDAEQICRQLFPAGSVAVVGCSVGGLIAMEFSRRCPELVEQLILHEPPLPALLPPDLDVQNKVDQIKNFLAQKKVHPGGKPLPGFVGRRGTFSKTKTAGDVRTGGKEPGLFHPQRVFAFLFFSAACSAPGIGLCDGGRGAGTPVALFVPSGQNLCGQMWLSVPSVPGQAQLCLGPAIGLCQNCGRNIGGP